MMGFRADSKAQIRRDIADGNHPTTAQLIETSMFGNEFHGDGKYVVVGPAPTNRKWFGEIEIVGGKIVSIS